MLDERSGYLEMVPGWNFSCVMAGAVLADLALEHRIETDLERLYLVDPTPTGDGLLDPTLKGIADSRREVGRPVLDRTKHPSCRRNRCGRAGPPGGAEHPCPRDGRVLGAHPRRFPVRGRIRRRITRRARNPKARILSVILQDEIPDPRDAILVALMHTCGGLQAAARGTGLRGAARPDRARRQAGSHRAGPWPAQ